MPLSILIIGGSDAGISAALRAHELDASARIAVALADAFPNFSICGLPFFLSGETPDWKHLTHRTEFPGIEILTNHLATSIAQFAGSLGTQVVKVFELAIARTGLREEEARKAGFDPLTVQSAFWDHKAYYPGAREIIFRICGDKSTGRLLGAQLIGHWKSEISKRVDIFATALFHNMTVEGLNELDLSYTPPLSSPWDPVQMAAQTWCRSFANLAT